MGKLVGVVVLLVPLLANAQPSVPQADDDEVPPGPPRVVLEPPQPEVEPPPPPPPPTRLVREHRWNLFTAGTCTFAGSWMAPLVVGSATRQYELIAPLVGPLLQIRHLQNDGTPFPGMFAAVLVLDALVQAGGLAMLIAGVTTRRNVRLPIQVAPAAGVSGGGLVVAGRF
jgi:hypothetical protein